MIREHRGDGHFAILASESIDGCEANVLMAAEGLVSEKEQPSFRGWSDAEWSAAVERLQARGLLENGELTSSGRELRERVETRTDELAAETVNAMSSDGFEIFAATAARLANRVLENGGIPFPNAMAFPHPPRSGSNAFPAPLSRAPSS